jgi:nicotinamide-nucleotide amidase
MIEVKIISIGDELLIGNTINTNSTWLSKELTNIGLTVTSSVMIPDDKERIIHSLNSSKESIIITTGGLGPTKDDITKKVIANYLESELVTDENQLERVKSYFKSKNRPLKKSHFDQALRPKLSESLNNNVGTAPGIYSEFKEKVYVNLPGVPSEMKDIFDNEVKNKLLHYIESNLNDYFKYQTIYTTGLPESELAERIEHLDDQYSQVKFAYLPSPSGVNVRLGILNSELDSNEQNLFQTVKNKISELIGSYIIEEENSLFESTVELLFKMNSTVSVAESCTGGSLGKQFTEKSGSSAYFEGGVITYSNISKMKILSINKETLDNFGAVSKETAEEMAVNCQKLFNTNYSISITGIAGPNGGSPDKPVGTIFIAVYNGDKTYIEKLSLSKNNRESNRDYSVQKAISLLYRTIKKSIK